MSTMVGVVDDVRGFNRFYTRVLGLLRPDLAGSAFGLTEARVLFELAHGDDVAVSDLRRELDLDAGYLSRILSGFTAVRARGPGAVGDRRSSTGRPADDAMAGGLRGTRPVAGAPRSTRCWLLWTRDQRSQLVTAMGRDPSRARRPAASAGARSSRARAGRPRLGRRAPWRPLCRRVRLGRRRSRRWSHASSPTSPSAATPTARRRGSPSWTASGSAACSARPRIPRTPRSCACCSSSPSARGSGRRHPAGRRVPAVRQAIRLRANHVVDQRCARRRAAHLRARRLSARSPRAAPQLRARSRRRVLVARPVDQARPVSARAPAPAGCRASSPAAGHPSSPSCACRWAGS